MTVIPKGSILVIVDKPASNFNPAGEMDYMCGRQIRLSEDWNTGRLLFVADKHGNRTWSIIIKNIKTIKLPTGEVKRVIDGEIQ